MCPNPQETSDSVTFTEEILDGKLHFLCCKTFLPHRNESNNSYHIHCVKSVYIRSFSGLHFPAFGLNTERYGVSEHFHLVILQLAKFCKLQKLGLMMDKRLQLFHTFFIVMFRVDQISQFF